VLLPHDERGSGDAVVLLHAGVADRTEWRAHLEPLAAASRRVVAMDLPGFGDAPEPPGPQAPWRDVLETMDALDIGRAALVGNSAGAGVALRVAAVAPERVAALVLISARVPGAEPSPQLGAVWAAEEAGLQRGDVEAAVAAVVSAWTLPDAPADVREQVAAMQRRAFATQLATTDFTEAPDPVEDNPAILSDLQIDALCIAGGRELPDFRDGAVTLAATLPRGRHAEIASAGHLAPLETPRELRALLLDFLSDRNS
jgi:pimeloyl-ACP methyl ester carboxylesterase